MSEIYHMPPIEKPSEQQVGYFLMKAAILDEIMEQGGITAEEAMQQRRLTLARIGMGDNNE